MWGGCASLARHKNNQKVHRQEFLLECVDTHKHKLTYTRTYAYTQTLTHTITHTHTLITIHTDETHTISRTDKNIEI